MKKTIFILTLALIGLTSLKAQTSFNCTYTQYSLWNEYAEKFETRESYKESSLFVMDYNKTWFIHTIEETIKSTYYVSAKEYLNEEDVWTYVVTDEAGNAYIFFLALKTKKLEHYTAKAIK